MTIATGLAIHITPFDLHIEKISCNHGRHELKCLNKKSNWQDIGAENDGTVKDMVTSYQEWRGIK